MPKQCDYSLLTMFPGGRSFQSHLLKQFEESEWYKKPTTRVAETIERIQITLRKNQFDIWWSLFWNIKTIDSNLWLSIRI